MHQVCTLLYILAFLLGQTASYIDLHTLRSDEIAIMQYDSRKMGDYWQAAALWNKHYCEKHGHKFIYYASKEGCHYHGEKLATPWCKVKAMIQANADFPEVKFFIYMDSDAVLDKQFAEMPLMTIVGTMQAKLDWDPKKKPVIFNQDGPCWWCRLVQSVGYDMCLNAGTMYFCCRPFLWKDSPFEGRHISFHHTRASLCDLHPCFCSQAQLRGTDTS
jgi:hypothetical protein